MQELIQFFETLPTLYKLGWIFICLGIAWIMEFGFPLLSMEYGKWSHALKNFAFLGTSIIINVVFGIITVGVFLWIDDNNFGVLQVLDLPPVIALILAVMALDFFAQYVAHYLLHKIRWMWRFHMVHHSDTKVDATTGTRHHPGDYVIREIFSIVTVFFIGIPFAFYMFYRIATIFFTYMSHANIKLPQWLDKGISLVFISPDMHKFHHHHERPWTDTNFGNIFSLWDRIFGTMVYDDPSKVEYGLDVLDGAFDENLKYQFSLPFKKGIKTD